MDITRGSNLQLTARCPSPFSLSPSLDFLPPCNASFAEPDWDTLPLLARQWDLTVYDAAYLQLALKRKAPLVTLDARLAGAYDKAAGL